MGNLFEEFKRRKVFRVAAVYAVVSWVLIQVADTVLPALQMPDWTVSFVTVLFILGFPIAVILAWAYEANRNQDVAQTSSIYAFADPTGRTGRLACDLGRADLGLGLRLHNNSILFWILQAEVINLP